MHRKPQTHTEAYEHTYAHTQAYKPPSIYPGSARPLPFYPHNLWTGVASK